MGISLFVRRSWGWVLPLFGVIQTLAMLNVQSSDQTPLPAWSLDWSWMLSVWGGATLILSPAAAGAAALLVLREFPADTRQVTTGLRRYARPLVDVGVAVWLQGATVQLMSLCVAGLMCLSMGADATGLTLPWQLQTAPAALFAAVAAGVAVAAIGGDVWAVPGVMLAMFLAHRVFYWAGYPELFTLEMATWMMSPARPLVTHLTATTALNLVTGVGLAAGVVYLSGARGVRSRRALVLMVCAVAAALALYLPFVAAGAYDTYGLP